MKTTVTTKPGQNLGGSLSGQGYAWTEPAQVRAEEGLQRQVLALQRFPAILLISLLALPFSSAAVSWKKFALPSSPASTQRAYRETKWPGKLPN